ncbi:DUF1153 domain-containing protein [Actinacidiphila glaucinigra]|uniref:DUF1153 domain-containing protein n=1 Tax=Actinacidiphila glaucinigra TaxID=235986 RepID=UPI0033CF57FB
MQSHRVWKRPLALVVMAAAVAGGGACSFQGSSSEASPAQTRHDGSRGADGARGSDSVAGLLAGCARGGEGGEGGQGGRPGEPGQPGRPGEPGGAACLRLADLPSEPAERLSAVDKARIVLTVTSGHATRAEVAEKYKVPEKMFDIWKEQVLDGDWLGLSGRGFPFST